MYIEYLDLNFWAKLWPITEAVYISLEFAVFKVI